MAARSSNAKGSGGGKQMSPRQRRARLKLTVIGATAGGAAGAGYGIALGDPRRQKKLNKLRASGQFNLRHESRGFAWETSASAPKAWALPIKHGVGVTTKQPRLLGYHAQHAAAGGLVGAVSGGVAGYRTANKAARGRGFDTSRRSGRGGRQRRDRRGRFA